MSRALGFVAVKNTSQESVVDIRRIRYDTFVAGLFKQDTLSMMINHAALGVCGEAGELADALKKHVHYGKPLDRANVVEELGDLRFYIQAVMNLFSIEEAEVLQTNADKLMTRYVSGTYSNQEAIDRADKKVTGDE